MKNPWLFETYMMQMWMDLFLDELLDTVLDFTVDVQTFTCKTLLLQ